VHVGLWGQLLPRVLTYRWGSIMTTTAKTLIRKLDKLGYHVLTYRQGTVYVAGVGMRDMIWAQRIIKGMRP